ncbi:Hypothetical protein NTJ_02037 [Nesidiocoris tenuis]|uniref:Paired domain-containing protein n=1 Tax=Nesidiocoris tenuis TaxID=355587 RepID=A0ABN7AA85_9HEMI|nr:Hypothetical protein NTJ_02037 [Nesidiocoris tenuis]
MVRSLPRISKGEIARRRRVSIVSILGGPPARIERVDLSIAAVSIPTCRRHGTRQGANHPLTIRSLHTHPDSRTSPTLIGPELVVSVLVE